MPGPFSRAVISHWFPPAPRQWTGPTEAVMDRSSQPCLQRQQEAGRSTNQTPAPPPPRAPEMARKGPFKEPFLGARTWGYQRQGSWAVPGVRF